MFSDSQSRMLQSRHAPRDGAEVKNTDVISTEVADRLKAIGVLGERVSQDRITPADATQLADALLGHCWRHLTHGTEN